MDKEIYVFNTWGFAIEKGKIIKDTEKQIVVYISSWGNVTVYRFFFFYTYKEALEFKKEYLHKSINNCLDEIKPCSKKIEEYQSGLLDVEKELEVRRLNNE